MELAEATSLYLRLVRPWVGTKSLGLAILRKFYLSHMTTLRRSLETHHSLGAYPKNTSLVNLKLSLNLI